MTEEHWRVGFAKSLSVLFNGKALPDPDLRGERVTDSSFLVLFNAHYEPLAFTLPEVAWGTEWTQLLDTAQGGFIEDKKPFSPTHRLSLRAVP